MKRSEIEINFAIQNAAASLAMENMPLSEDMIEDLRKTLNGEMTESEYYAKCLSDEMNK